MTKSEDNLGARLFLARNQLERRRGETVSYAELGKLVAEREGRRDHRGKVMPYTSGNVNRWVHNRKEPGRAALAAFAEVCGVSKGWLAYGEGPMEAPAEGERKLQTGLTPATKKEKGRKSATR